MTGENDFGEIEKSEKIRVGFKLATSGILDRRSSNRANAAVSSSIQGEC